MKFLFALLLVSSFTIFHSFSQKSEVEVLNDLTEFLLIGGNSTSSISADTNLLLNQIYNPVFLSSYQNIFAGNIGTASFNLVRTIPTEAFLDWGINHYDDYKLGNSKRNIILNKKPFSRVNYLLGSKKEQVLNVTHQQHITKNMIAGLDYLTEASNGFYSDQLSKQRSFDAFYLMNTNNNMYKLLASYTSNRHEAQENGGIVNDTLFINYTDNRDAEESLVNLLSAKSLNKDNTYFLKQKLNLVNNSTKFTDADSLENNRLSISLNNTSKYSRKAFLFEETNVDLDFFNSIYYDSVSTYDSSFVTEIVNKFGIEFQKNLGIQTNANLEIFTNFQEFTYFQNYIDTAINSFDVGIATGIKQNEIFELSLLGKFALTKELKNNYFFSGALKYDVSKKIKFESRISFIEKPGSIIFKLFDSNHFKWTNNFKNENKSDISVLIGFKELVKIKYNLKKYNNYLFFDSLINAQQFGEDINVSMFEFSHTLNFRKFNYNGITSYNTSNYEEIIPVPEIQLFHSIYYEDKLFKVRMPIQVGVDLRYHTKYFAQAYMPAIGQRYVQTKQAIGNYLFADFFFNFKINNSKLFFKVDHFNEGFTKRNYFIMPYHPMMGRSFKVGIKWVFLD